MRTGHLSGVSNKGVGTKLHVNRETGASTVTHRGLAQRIADTAVAGFRNFAGLPARSPEVIALHARQAA